MGVKATYAEIKALFESKGFKLISTSYVNALTPLQYICSCGKYTIEAVQAIFELNDCFLLTEQYLDNNQILDYVCNCGEVATTRLRSFMRGHRCLKCAPSKMGLSSIRHGNSSIPKF